jgi:hypothetical protein
MGKCVEITDLGDLHWLLGIEIVRECETHTLQISQQSYIESILCCYNLEELKPSLTPMDPNICLTTSQSPSTTLESTEMCNIPYHEAASSLMYASLVIHLDITFAIQVILHFLMNSG